VTFKYTASGPEGLLRGKRAVIFITRGGRYASDQESQTAYLRQILGFLGIKDIEFIYAEGLSLGEESIRQSLGHASDSIRALVQQQHALAA
jgi:FMN-dependent NADH-azoreductase